MDKQERILKFLQGRAISRRDYDEAKSQYEAAFNGASDDQKAQATAYLQSVLNKQSADPKSNKHARHTGAEAYRIATTMLNGTFDPAAVASPLGTAGVLTRRQDYADAGNVAVEFYNLNKNNNTQSNLSTSSQTSSGRYFFDAMNGLNPIGQGINVTRGDLVGKYASQLLSNITGAKNAEEVEHKTVYNKVNGMYDDIAKLEAIIKDPNSDTSYNSLLDVASKYDTPDHWKSYFGNLIADNQEVTDEALLELLNQGYKDNVDLNSQPEFVKNLITKKNLKFLRDKEGNIRAFTSDWNEYNTPFADWNDDWTQDTDELRDSKGYNYGMFIDDLGRVHFGNISGLEGTNWEDVFKNELEERKKDDGSRGKLYNTFTFNTATSHSNDNLFNAFINNYKNYFTERTGKQLGWVSGADVSQLFRGADRVFAVNPNKLLDVVNGNIKFDDLTDFFVVGSNGKVTRKKWKDLKSEYKHKGFDEGTQYTPLLDFTDNLQDIKSNISLNEDLGGRTFGTAVSNGGYKPDLLRLVDLLSGSAMSEYNSYENINENPKLFVYSLLDAIQNGGLGSLKYKIRGVHDRRKLLTNLNYYDNKDDWDALLILLIQGNNKLVPYETLPSDLKDTYLTLRNAYLQRTSRYKDGGEIQFAAKGTVLDAYGNDITNGPAKRVRSKIENYNQQEAEAREQGYKNLYQKEANEEQVFKGDENLTKADILRFATMAQDVGSIVASFMPGAGTAVAAGLGVTSMGTDLVADLHDPAVSTGETIKNTFRNLGFAALGMIPGAKMGKVARNIVKYTPKIITAMAGLGIAMDQSTHETFKKLQSGKLNMLNRQDWRNLSHVLSLVAAGTRGVKGDIARRQVGKGIVTGENVKLKGVKNANGNDIELPKSKVKEINDELAKVKTPEELATIRKKYSLPEEAIKAPMIKEGKLAGKYKLVDTELTKDGDAIRAIWNEEARSVENSSKVGRWFANKLGGGDYTAKQRAILGLDLEDTGINISNLMQYKGNYNPSIDWQNLRKTAGATRMKARYTTPEYKPEPAPIERRNPAVERSIETPREIPVLERVVASKTKGAKDYSEFKLNEMNRKHEFESTSQLNKIKLPKESQIAAELFAKQFGIEIKDKRAYFRFILDLKKFHPELYRQFLSRKPITNPKEFMSFAKEDYNFKDGGKVNYQKLRKQ